MMRLYAPPLMQRAAVRTSLQHPLHVVMAKPPADDPLNDGAACLKLDDDELPDCVDPQRGDWYACDEPPADDAAMQCFQLEELPECEDEGAEHAPKLNDKKSWICIDGASYNREKGSEDSY